MLRSMIGCLSLLSSSGHKLALIRTLTLISMNLEWSCAQRQLRKPSRVKKLKVSLTKLLLNFRRLRPWLSSTGAMSYAARNKIPLDKSAGKEIVDAHLQAAYNWVKEKYSLARDKYEQALLIKPDFYEGLLALGQQQFEMAKLHWSFALAKKIDLSTWDSAETLNLFDSAEEKMKAATGMWEELEEQRLNELKDPNSAKEEELLRRKKKQARGSEGEAVAVAGQGEISPEEAAEQAAVMRSQIHLFWGSMLYERSQVECKLGLDGWKEKLDVAVERFKSAGASEADISVVLKNHCSHVNSAETTEMKQAADNANNNVVIETS